VRGAKTKTINAKQAKLNNCKNTKIKLLKTNAAAVNIFKNVILARNRQLPDDDRMIETCRSIFKNVLIQN